MPTNENKELLKAQYEAMVRQELSKVTFNVNVYKEFLKFFLTTIVCGSFFAWCSSSDESFLPALIKENMYVRIIICFLPLICLVIYEAVVVLTASNIRKKIDFEEEMSSHFWKKLYYRFILDKIGYKRADNVIVNLDEIRNLYNSHEDIIFWEDEFSQYLYNYYAKYKLDFSIDFYNNLAKVILLENEINGTLIAEGYEKYTFIVKDNEEFMMMSSFYI